MPKTVQPWSAPDLKQRCRTLRAALLEAETATSDEIAVYWPGGEWNQEPGKGAWIFCYAQLIRFAGRRENRDSDGTIAAAHRAIAQAASREPETVKLSDGSTVQVHPKSYNALRFLDSLKLGLNQVLGAQLLALGNPSIPEEQAVATLAPLCDSLILQLWAWVITHPAVGLPFTLSGTMPDPPASIAVLAPEDFLALWGAHYRVNRERLVLMAKINPSDQGAEGALAIEGLVSAYAAEKGLPTFDVLSSWTLAEVYAQSVSSAIAAREAKARAESNGNRSH